MVKGSAYYYIGNQKIPIRPSGRITAHRYSEAFRNSSDLIDNLVRDNRDLKNLELFESTELMLIDNKKNSDTAEAIRTTLRDETENLAVFESDQQLPLIVTDEIIVKFRSEISETEIAKLNSENNLIILSAVHSEPNYFILKTTLTDPIERLMLANRYHELDSVVFAQINFIQVFSNFNVPDPYFSQQWALKNTGQFGGKAGEDINIEAAWVITKGDPSVTIAIIDTGIDYTHPDLNVQIGGISKLKTGFNALNNTTDQNPRPDISHGTSCAGIASAAINDMGIAGIAPDCCVMGIKISNDGKDFAEKCIQISTAIRAAVDRGADVINCSWGGVDACDEIINALSYAKTKGRGGRGCALVFAAGNSNADLLFPASSPLVITVTASNQFGEFKQQNSADGEPWSSSSGEQVDICAPGLKIATLSNNKKYNLNFYGTSAAAPMVAGTIALMLSVNPVLTVGEVEEILKKSARAPEGIDLPSLKYGFGLLDAGQAVKLASASNTYLFNA